MCTGVWYNRAVLVTKLTQKALERASELHEGQVRKGAKPIPVVAHLVDVASTVSKYTDDEEIVAAAILHDTIEDTDYTEEQLREEFGGRVADMVLRVSIPEAQEVKSGWTDDRTRYIKNLGGSDADSAMIAAADKIHNFGTALAQYGDNPEGFRSAFAGTPADRLAVYSAVVEVITEKLGEENPLAKELQAMWSRYKAFVESL